FCVLPLPPAAVYLAVKSGAFAFPPHGRVFFYLQPFLFICAAAGARALTAKIAAFAGARSPAMAPARTAAHILFGALFVPLAICAAQDLKNNYYPERAGREPLHKVLEFVKTLGPWDLFLTSNGPHVEFYLYGADEMRRRVNNIVDQGELGGIYFLERRRGNQSDVDRTVREGVEYLELKDYSQVNPLGRGPEPLRLPAALVEPVARFDNLVIRRIKPQHIKKAYSLKTPGDMDRWLISAESPAHLESFRTASGAQPVLAFNGSIVLLSKLPREAEKDGFDLNVNFLTARTQEDQAVAYLNGVVREGNVVFNASWMANAWTLDHPYGGNIFRREWRPAIFFSDIGSSSEVVQAHQDDPGAPGALRGLLSYRITMTDEELRKTKDGP
ncbi:MAG: hypothetical protein HY580_01090, partial [Nitrospinae bacterium]|nr:hypothetical protein [Nitrospinota bacterium]